MAEPRGKFDVFLQLRHKIKRVVKRRINYLRNRLTSTGGAALAPAEAKGTTASQNFVAGQLVRVRSREQIQATLDNWNYLKGCGFMEEMWPYCGTTQRILKPVRRFVDERDHRLKKTRGIYFLEGVHCQGTIDYGRCDRNCYFFWREEWLEEVE
jgi:hypothetical protein